MVVAVGEAAVVSMAVTRKVVAAEMGLDPSAVSQARHTPRTFVVVGVMVVAVGEAAVANLALARKEEAERKIVEAQWKMPIHRLTESPNAGADKTIEGVILDVSWSSIRIEVVDHVDVSKLVLDSKRDKLTWRLDKGFSRVTYERIYSALQDLDAMMRDARAVAPIINFVVHSHSASTSDARHAPPTMDAILPSIVPCFSDVQCQYRRDAWAAKLNNSQMLAVSKMFDNRITIIQGPPGTGKTQTCAATLCKMAEMYGPGKVLACAFNNVAIDEISKRTKAIGGDNLIVVRLGEVSRSDPEAAALALSNLENVKATKLREKLKTVRKQLDELRRLRDGYQQEGNRAHAQRLKYLEAQKGVQSQIDKAQKRNAPGKSKKVKKPNQQLENTDAKLLALILALRAQLGDAAIAAAEWKAKKDAAFAAHDEVDANCVKLLPTMRNLERELKDIRRQLISSADVLCCTCIGVGSSDVHKLRFSGILIDECTQALEPACIIPIMKLVSPDSRLVLAGDHKQLPPTVSCPDINGNGLTRSLFERLMAVEQSAAPQLVGLTSCMLRIQYRMHPDISAFPSKQFYEGKLVDGVKSSDRELTFLSMQQAISEVMPGQLEWSMASTRVLFINLDAAAGDGVAALEESCDKSKVNHASAAIVRATVAALVKHKVVNAKDVGVITPYAKQRQLLATATDSWKGSSKKKAAVNLPDGVEVKTVDGFQGREKEVIVLDTVRCNDKGSIGFLKDERRLNVAITRARKLLIIIGSMVTLEGSASESWVALLRHLDSGNHGQKAKCCNMS
eukprot:gene12492-14757_t